MKKYNVDISLFYFTSKILQNLMKNVVLFQSNKHESRYSVALVVI